MKTKSLNVLSIKRLVIMGRMYQRLSKLDRGSM